MNRLRPLLPLASSACALLIGLTSAEASSFDRVSFRDRITRAELIVQGVVTKIDQRNSDVAGPEHVRLPHTFVTIQIERLFKGTAADGDSITLRFEGGPDGEGRFLHVSGVPNFRLGDRDVLFIRKNGTSICPLVAWEQGRLRVIRGEVFDEFGDDVWVTPDGDLAFGERRIDVRSPAYPEVESAAESLESSTPPAPIGSVRPDADGLALLLQDASAVLAAASLVPDAPTPSADIARPFYVKELRPVSPPVDLAASLAPPTDDDELLRATNDESNR